MPLYIKDDHVNDLALELQKLTRAPSKVYAVRAALELAIRNQKSLQNFDERCAGSLAMARSLGAGDPDFDMKAFTDAGWGG